MFIHFILYYISFIYSIKFTKNAQISYYTLGDNMMTLRLGSTGPLEVFYSSRILQINIESIRRLYPFIEIGSIGTSILGKNIPYIRIGRGAKEVFYSASIHANEWITAPLLMKFVSDYCYTYQNNLTIFGYSARQLYNTTSIYVVPMVNPDGVDLVTGELKPNSSAYNFAKNIAEDYPDIPFPNGWKANIRRCRFEPSISCWLGTSKRNKIFTRFH